MDGFTEIFSRVNFTEKVKRHLSLAFQHLKLLFVEQVAHCQHCLK